MRWGTSKALQMGEVEGAMSGLSIAVAGVADGGALPHIRKPDLSGRYKDRPAL